MDELSIPVAALYDDASVQLISVWIASKRLHCSIKSGHVRRIVGGSGAEEGVGHHPGRCGPSRGQRVGVRLWNGPAIGASRDNARSTANWRCLHLLLNEDLSLGVARCVARHDAAFLLVEDGSGPIE